MRIYPKEKLNGTFFVPSDRYALHCAIVASALAKGKTTIIARADYTDIAQTVACVKRLGARVKRKGDLMEIRGIKEFKDKTYRLDCGNSGTTMRIMCGVAAGSKINAVLVGGKYLSKRTMQGVKEPLESMGATVALTDYTVPPIWVEGADIRPIEYYAERPVAQEKAAVLFAALCGNTRAVIKEKIPTDNSAEIILKEFGADIKTDGDKTTINKSELESGKTIYVAGDAHAASVILALGLLLGKTTVKNSTINPRKTRFIEVVRRMGGNITIENKRRLCGETIGDITATESKLKATHVDSAEAALLAGDLPILAVLMGVAEGESIIADYKDELSGSVSRTEHLCDTLNALGGKATAFDGGLLIKGVEKYTGGNIKTYFDHRISLAGAVALAASKNGGELDDDNCAYASFPEFFEQLKGNDVGVIGKDGVSKEAFYMHDFILSRLGVTRYSVSAYRVPTDNPRRFFSEMKLHAGYNVYYPYSQEAIKSVRLSPTAAQLRAMDAAKAGEGYSFLGNAVVLAVKYIGESLFGKKVLVIGGGNAARSVIHALIGEKAKVSVYDKDYKAALDVSKRTKGVVVAEEKPAGEYFAVVNATLCGSGYYADELPFDIGADFKPDLAIDLAISDKKTPFLSYAEVRGAKTMDGKSAAFLTAYLSDAVFYDKAFYENDAFAALSDFESEK